MGRVKQKSAFEHAQNVRIHNILRMREVLSGHLLSIETFYTIQWFCLRTAKALIDCADAQADLGLRCLLMPEDTFLHGRA